MQILRTIVWVLLVAALLLFSVANWAPIVTVRIWEGLVVDTKIPAIVVVSFLIGFVPMWLFDRARTWQLKRRIQTLEANLRTAHATQAQTAQEMDSARLAEERLARERPGSIVSPPPV